MPVGRTESPIKHSAVSLLQYLRNPTRFLGTPLPGCALIARSAFAANSTPAGLFGAGRQGVVAFARLHLEFFAVLDPDFDLAETAVALRVSGRIGDDVLAAQLLLELIVNVRERVGAGDAGGAAAGLVGQLAHLAFGRAAAAEHGAVEARVFVQDDVNDRVRFLRRLDRLAGLGAAALVVAIRNQHQRLDRKSTRLNSSHLG